MKISYNWLQSFFRGELPDPEKLAELLTFHSTEVGGMERKSGDYVLTLDVLPNRAHDLLSHQGVSREAAAITGIRCSSYPTESPSEIKNLSISEFVKVEVKNSQLCHRYTARFVRDIKIKPSPKWLRERLEAVGIRAINNVVDAANYVMLELGQPLHAFDFDKLERVKKAKGKRPAPKGRGSPNRVARQKVKIIVRRAKRGEKIVTLDGEERLLDVSTLVIADSKKPIAIAGIMGGKNTEIDTTTKNLILESANFNPLTIRTSSRALGLRTESSLRFEYGLDPNLASEAVDRLAVLIHKLAGGEVARGRIDIYPKKTRPRKILLDVEYARRLLGVQISEKEIHAIFKKLGFAVKKEAHSAKFLVTIPTFRQDITIQEDVIEEIARIYGYEHIPDLAPLFEVSVRLREDHRDYARLLRKFLEGLGYTETYNHSFWGKRTPELINFKSGGPIRLENPISEEYVYLRSSLMPLLLENVALNRSYGRDIKLFELGNVYMNGGRSKACFQKERAAFVATKDAGATSLSGFYKLKGEVEWLLSCFGIPDVSFVSLSAYGGDAGSIWNPKGSAMVRCKQEILGTIGEINSFILERFRIQEKVFAGDLDFGAIIAHAARRERYYEAPSRYPAVFRDIALLVPFEVRVEEVLNVIHRAGGILVRDVDLFDMYEGDELSEGHKNLAFHIVYRADDRTLTSKEADGLHGKIMKGLEEEGWEVRK